jgi:hypothetical protein
MPRPRNQLAINHYRVIFDGWRFFDGCPNDGHEYDPPVPGLLAGLLAVVRDLVAGRPMGAARQGQRN